MTGDIFNKFDAAAARTAATVAFIKGPTLQVCDSVGLELRLIVNVGLQNEMAAVNDRYGKRPPNTANTRAIRSTTRSLRREASCGPE